MSPEPVIVHEAEREWETWPDAEAPRRGPVSWKTLISAGATRSDSLTFGVATLAPGEEFQEHRHEQAEVYFVLEGSCLVTIEGEEAVAGPGAAVFIPANALHACRNVGATELRTVYVFAADAFEDVRYDFGEDDGGPGPAAAR